MSKRVLIVDDSAIARSIIKRVFDVSGISDAEFLEANNGREALEVLTKQRCHLVISDLNMPDMDGEELLKRIKSSPKLHDTPVVIISSLGNPAKEKKLIADHAESVFTKPVSVPELTEFLNEFWENLSEDE
ncbi:MAG: response regulator [Calditrichia bacterium]